MAGVSCWTGYLVREEDGTCRYAARKYGDWLIVDSDRLADVLARVRRDGVLVDSATAGDFDGWCCRGVAIDLPGRRYRCFPCRPRFVATEHADRQVRAAEIWRGWDATIARGGREELAELLPEASAVVAPYAAPMYPLAELVLDDRDEWFAGWDPAAFELTVWDDEYSANWTSSHCDLVTVVSADLAVLDYRVDAGYSDVDEVVRWLAHGPPLLDALDGSAPYPLPMEHQVSGGVVIDVPHKTLRHWSERFVPARLWSALPTVWPGWRVERFQYGLAEHLAATGRRNDELLDTDECDPAWDGARRSLPADPRPFRVPRIAVRER
jgi:hypothetical protein